MPTARNAPHSDSLFARPRHELQDMTHIYTSYAYTRYPESLNQPLMFSGVSGEDGAGEQYERVARQLARHLAENVVPVRTDPGLHRRKGFLDRVVVGGIRRKVYKTAASAKHISKETNRRR